MAMSKAVREHLEWMLRHARVKIVGDAKPEDLLRLLKEGPSDDHGELVVAESLSGDGGRSQLQQLIAGGAISVVAAEKTIRLLLSKQLLHRNGIYGYSPTDWLSWLNVIREIGYQSPAPKTGRGRRPLDPAGRPMTGAQRSQRYDEAKQAEGMVRKTVWITADAAKALDDIAGALVEPTSVGSIVSDAILSFHRSRGIHRA